MKELKSLGIWMDHAIAEIIDLDTERNIQTIKSEFTNETMRDAIQRSEHIMHNKEKQMHEAFYKEIGNEILKYDQVLLFGPTNAKVELYNYLKKDLHFKDIKMDIEPADKMTDNEKYAFVRKHYKK